MPVLLFSHLLADRVTRDDLAALGELARAPIAERALWLGALGPALAHEDAEIRAAALAALGGARGTPAFRALVAALEDPVLEVREAAVAALRASSSQMPGRWALALFHRDPSVRRAALAGAAPLGAEPLAIHLVFDPACADAVQLPDVPTAIGPMLRAARAGALDPERVRAWIEAHLGPPLYAELIRYRWRTASEIDPIVDGDDPGIANDDSLEDFFELWSDPSVDEARRALVLRDARAQLLGRAEPHRRAAAAILALLRRRGEIPDALAALLGALYPACLADARLPRALRLAAAEGPVEQGTGTPSLDAARVDAVLAGDLLRDPEGRLDARALAALLTVAPAGPVRERVLAAVGDAEIAAALDEAPHRAAPLVGHLAIAGRLEGLLALRPERRGLLFALAFAATPPDDLHALDVLDPSSALSAALALDALRERADVRLTPAKIERATTLLARLVGSRADSTTELLLDLAAEAGPGARVIALDVLGEIACALEVDAFVALVVGVGDRHLPGVLALLAHVTRLPFAKERALADALTEHASSEVRAWAEARIPRPALTMPTWTGVVPLGDEERARIAAAPTLDALVDALRPALVMPRQGVAEALAARGAYVSPVACAALLASHDEPASVARELTRWSDPSPAFRTQLDVEMVRRWCGRHDRLPLLANAWLHLFEAHAFALVHRLERADAGVSDALHEAVALPSPVLAQKMWSAVALTLEAWSRRDRDRAAALGTPAMFDLALAQLDTDLGEPAARILVALGRVLPARLAEHLPTLVARLADLPERTRERLAPIASVPGLGATRRAPRTRVSSDVEEAIARVRSLADLDALARECEGTVDLVVQEAAIALLTRGEAAGERRIAELLAREPAPPCAPSLAVAVDLFETEAARDEIEALLAAVPAWGTPRGAAAQPELRFRLALSLARAGRSALADIALAAACDPGGEIGWLRVEDVERLEALRPARDVARALVRSPHPRGHERAVQSLVVLHDPEPADLEALRAFLFEGRERSDALRQRAAEVLIEHHDRIGAPIVLSAALLARRALPPSLAKRMSEPLLGAMVEGALAAGQEHVDQLRLLDLLERLRTVLPAAHEASLRRVLEDASSMAARQRARAQLSPSRSRDVKLRTIAEVFAWGTVRGRELTGRMLRFHITDGGALGYAQMRTGDVNVTPMPILRGERDGRTIVEALVLHEIGHHAFHATPEALEVWDRAQKRGLARLLNLVLDEHLERNLRSREPEWGDRLKTLAAWAFRHASTDIAIDSLVYQLGERAFEVLCRIALGIAHAPNAVRVESGSLMAELDARGHSFARFVRALRLGLGDRSGDPRVAKALELFDRRFRSADPEALWQITLELQRLFAQEVDLVLGLGGAESITSPGELEAHGEGISDADVQREVQRVLEPPSSKAGDRAGGGANAINVGPDERWAPITRIDVLPPDPAKHAAVGASVRRHAERMRRYLESLGLRWEPQRMRLRGARLDTTRLRALVTRRDPRVLIARELRERTDLFLAVLVDCSGSMHGPYMERAHAFGVLLADAARDVPGLDFRAFGFTDRVIYDAGDARRPAITSLRAGGGNNDAAALAHVVQVARRSSRRAKLVVMISDGLPTECSVSALRACVREAGKKGVACAQVAVRPLEEVCFPHYVVIESAELDAAVARFGEVVARLVRQVMA